MIFFFAALTALIVIYMFLIFPGATRGKNIFVRQRLYAHRGLFSGDVPENSMAAFSAAIDAGYGIEFDVHVTLDGVAVVHHDDSLIRLCGDNRSIENSNYEDIKDITLPDGSRLPLLSEVLELVNGRVPLIIELKCEKIGNVRVADAAAKELGGYNGEYCIESFNPFIVRRYKKHKLGVMCGQLAGRTYFKNDGVLTRIMKFFAEHLIFNFISRPDFIAYEIEHRYNFSFWLCRILGAEKALWTVKDEKSRDVCIKLGTSVIFQDFKA